MSIAKNRSVRRLGLLISALAILAGASIYLLLRPGRFRVHSWLEAMGLHNILSRIRVSESLSDKFPHWFLYSLPDGLWAFAYTLLILSVWTGSRSRIRFFWYASIPILVFGFELMQAFSFFPGTFSVPDMLFIGLGMVTAMFILKWTKGHFALF